MTGVCGVSTAADRAPQVLEGDGALDDGTYPAGVKIPDSQLEALPLTKHDFHGDWNYTITPT